MFGSASPELELDTEYTIQQMLIYDDIRVAYYLATTHRAKEAAELVRKGAPNAKRLTNPAGVANLLYYLALVQLQLGDEAGYRASCKALFDLPLANFNDLMRSRPIWTACLAPNSLEDLNLLVTRAEAFVTNDTLNYRHVALTYLGAALYRAGRYAQAAERLEESGAVNPSDASPSFIDMNNYQRLFLAMTKWQLGEQDAARGLLAETRSAVDKELESPAITWNRRATLELLRDEAVALIEPNVANEAVEKKRHINAE
jgi:hypothetical protein